MAKLSRSLSVELFPHFLLPQANELSQLVGKAFKTAFACNSFKRDNKKQSSILDSMPPHLPSAAPRHWTMKTPPQSGHSPQTTPPGHTHQLEPISKPPPAVNPAAVTPGVSRLIYVYTKCSSTFLTSEGRQTTSL